MEAYVKVLSLNSVDNLLLITGRTHRGEKTTFCVEGINPYAFMKKKDFVKFEQSLENLVNHVDEGFVYLKDGEPCITLYFENKWDLYQNKKLIGEKYFIQADLPYELSIAVKYNIGRFIKIIGGLPPMPEATPRIIQSSYELLENIKKSVTLPIIYLDQIEEMDQEEIETIQFQPYKIAKIDIEVLSSNNEFPDENEAKEPIVSIVCECDEGTDVFYLGKTEFGTIVDKFYHKRANINLFESEQDMIATFYFHLKRHDIVLAWNSNFDYKYLKNRAKGYEMTFLSWDELQWFNLQQAVAQTQRFTTRFLSLKSIFNDLFQQKRHSWSLLPEQFQDYFTIDEKGFVKLNQKSLAFSYLKIRQSQSGGDVSRLYNNNEAKKLLLYNCRDVWDMTALETVGGINALLNLFDGLQLMRINDMFLHSLKIEPNALRFCMLNKVASPSKQFLVGTIDEGALVHTPKTGKLLNNVVMLDFSRFYISIILALQISPENIDGKQKKLFTNLPNKRSLSKPMYFLPALSRYLIDERNHAENKKLEANNHILREYWKSQATALKTLTSGLWGYISNSANIEKNQRASRYYASHVADMILQESRRKSLTLKKFIENNHIANKKYAVVYGDTDASLVQSEEEEDEKHTNVDPQRIADEVNIFLKAESDKDKYPYPILVKPELMYDRLCLVGKKYYYGRVVWEDGDFLDEPRYDIKGMQTKRGDNSQLSKDFQMQLIKSHLEKGEEGIFETVKYIRGYIKLNLQKMKKDIFDEEVFYFLQSIAKPIKIRKDFKDYNSPLWARYESACRSWNHYVKMNNFGYDNLMIKNTSGYVLEVNYCHVKDLTLKNNYLIFSDPTLLDWSKIDLNVVDILEKTIFQKIKNILTSLGYSDTQIKSASKGRRVKNPFD